MTDQELLELAAKAAGYTSHGYGEFGGGDPFLYLQEADFTGMWAPLTDDGDALRLAVKLDICIQPGCKSDYDVEYSAAYVMTAVRIEASAREPSGDDKQAATRRAIVRAAAEIGKTME
jgi:hypothetical protein